MTLKMMVLFLMIVLLIEFHLFDQSLVYPDILIKSSLVKWILTGYRPKLSGTILVDR